MNSDLQMLMIVPVDERREGKENDEKQNISNKALNPTLPRLPAVSTLSATTTLTSKPTTADSLAKRSKNLHCHQLVYTFGIAGSDYFYNSKRLSLCVALIDGVPPRVHSQSLQARLLQAHHYRIQPDTLQIPGCTTHCDTRYIGATWPTT